MIRLDLRGVAVSTRIFIAESVIDGINGFIEKMEKAEGILLGSPVYFSNVTAQMKAFIDRFVFFNCPGNRAKVRGKKAVVAVPFEEEKAEAAQRGVDPYEIITAKAATAPPLAGASMANTAQEHVCRLTTSFPQSVARPPNGRWGPSAK